jgi:hypothetical protein
MDSGLGCAKLKSEMITVMITSTQSSMAKCIRRDSYQYFPRSIFETTEQSLFKYEVT